MRYVRDQLLSKITKDLLGPSNEFEKLPTVLRPTEKYLLGMLAPLGVEIDPIGNGSTQSGATSEEGTPDLDNITPGMLVPSSMGFSFSVDTMVDSIKVICSWGRYTKESEQIKETHDGSEFRFWDREPISSEYKLDLKISSGRFVPCKDFEKVYVKYNVRKKLDTWLVTLFLVNGQEDLSQNKDENWLFQAKIRVEGVDGKSVFVKKVLGYIETDPELSNLELLYRHQVEFATGHSVGVKVDVDPTNPLVAQAIETSFLPSYEVPMVETPTAQDNPDLDGLSLDMKDLANLSKDDLASKLSILVRAYRNWIDKQNSKIQQDSEAYKKYKHDIEENIENCIKTLARIEEGISLVASDNDAYDSFIFMNKVMWKQRVHSIFTYEKKAGSNKQLVDFDIEKNRSWRAFQLAFILINIPGVTLLDHNDRSESSNAVADLLWFPTGGGKTEAYLGLSAYTMAIRRLQKVEGYRGDYGVAVLMRYTLRLLTLQQFQRASALICACEDERKRDPSKWGMDSFRIGLWVGQKTTPNSTKDADTYVKQTKGNNQGAPKSGLGSTDQITSCPWCGSSIRQTVETFQTGRGRTLSYCTNSPCSFSELNSPLEGIPVVVVDEEIYRVLPTLLISTVDKFAQLPWNGAVQNIFGKTESYCERHGFRNSNLEDSDSHRAKGKLPAATTLNLGLIRPPDLIIQDELHLISGPLGSLVGIYETAVDELCSFSYNNVKIRPKVIASTATIRQAKKQIQSIFDRQVNIFPPQAIDIRDNFFSITRPVSENYPGRKYIGICAPGKRLKAALIRVFSAQMAAAQRVYQESGDNADYYMTTVGYFNSIRELGSVRRLLDDDIRSRLYRVEEDDPNLSKRNIYPETIEELTSRMKASQIPEKLDRLGVRYNHHLTKDQRNNKYSVDAVLATNMISVGVDVSRLGAMIVVGQPKTTSEYIQASSRVGRDKNGPGLVLTVFNWARPRDLSHYETFEYYHSTFYKHVEALSVTPFSEGAMRRALSALLVSIVRLSGQRFNANNGAHSIKRDDPEVKNAIEVIVKRATSVYQDTKLGDRVRKLLHQSLDFWINETRRGSGAELHYKQEKNHDTAIALLKNSDEGFDNFFACLNSLREVEPTVNIVLRPELGLNSSNGVDHGE
jgi:uncharacterized protein YifE (UPF0438 family)